MGDTVYIVAPALEESNQILDALSSTDFQLRTFDTAEALLAELAATCGCVLVPADLPGMGVRGLIEEIRRQQLDIAVVVIGRDRDLSTAVDLVRAGAVDFLEHPMNVRRLRSVVRRVISAARAAAGHPR